jgi:magnesium transporter
VLPTGQGITHTQSLPEVLSQLDTALKRSTRIQKNLERKAAVVQDAAAHAHHDHMLPDFVRVPSRPASFTDLKVPGRKRGKRKDAGLSAGTTGDKPIDENSSKAWFLDVASPLSADMHAIGKARTAPTTILG